MNVQAYSIIKNERKRNTFEFVSQGERDVLKVVVLQKTDEVNVYNLAMGDLINGRVNYSNVTDNKDTAIVIQTIGEIVQMFTKNNYERRVFVTGNTPARIRLYRRYLSNNLEKVTDKFYVWGANDDGTGFEVFKKGKNYTGFLVQRVRKT